MNPEKLYSVRFNNSKNSITKLYTSTSLYVRVRHTSKPLLGNYLLVHGLNFLAIQLFLPRT